MKVIIPVAGKGVRLQPYTNDRPKCLLPVGGKTIIDWIVEDTQKLNPTETIFIAGYKFEKFEEFLADRNWKQTRIILQNNPQGLGEAISLSLPYIQDDEPILIVLGDTIFDADLSEILNAEENIIYTYRVDEPSRFGVVKKDLNGFITKLEEKPKTYISNEAIVGIYYIRNVKDLKVALGRIINESVRINNEFQLTTALQMMIEQGCKFKTKQIKEWLDCGLPETLLKTNAWLLENKIGQSYVYESSAIIPPCYIGKNVVLENSTIGPNVSIGDNCEIKSSTISNCIVWNNSKLTNEKLIKKIVPSENY